MTCRKPSIANRCSFWTQAHDRPIAADAGLRCASGADLSLPTQCAADNSLDLKNQSARHSDEVAQLDVQLPDSELLRPTRALHMNELSGDHS